MKNPSKVVLMKNMVGPGEVDEELEPEVKEECEQKYGASEYGTGEEEFKAPMAPVMAEDKPRPSITDMMKNPSKVVLMKNMVGPGEVDEELEPEVKEECEQKYS